MSTYAIHNKLPFENSNERLLVVMFLSAGLFGFALGCQSDTVSNPGGAAATAGTAGIATGPTNFAAQLLESQNETPMPPTLSLTVRVVDNTTGQPLAGIEAKSDENSWVYFQNLPAGLVGFLVLAEPGQSIDTYQFNIDSNRQDETLWVVAMSAVQLAPTFTGVPIDSTKAVVAGAIYWIDPSTGEEKEVGCAEVTHTAAEGVVRYFGGNNLPCAYEFRPEVPQQEVRTSTNPLNGRYYIANATPGPITVQATLNGQTIGQTTMMSFAGTSSSDGANAISISNIYVEGAANPTPPDCTVNYL